MGKNIKQHDKVKIITVVETANGRIPRSQLTLTQCYNERGGKPRMFWISKKDCEARWQKKPGDEKIIQE